MTDHDETLGVSTIATGEEIRKAWRQAAQRFHPDAPHNPTTSALFLKAKDAYEIPSGGGRGGGSRARLTPPWVHAPLFSPRPGNPGCPGLLIPFSGGAR